MFEKIVWIGGWRRWQIRGKCVGKWEARRFEMVTKRCCGELTAGEQKAVRTHQTLTVCNSDCRDLKTVWGCMFVCI